MTFFLSSDPGVFVYCCDFADSAVQLVKVKFISNVSIAYYLNTLG